jgi:hypothetical protein
MAKDKAVKFTEDEMTKLQELQQTYNGIQNGYGQVGVQRIRLEQQLADLENAEAGMKTQFEDTQTKEREFVQSINKKYGDGNLDVNTGEFTPAPPAEEASDKTL